MSEHDPKPPPIQILHLEDSMLDHQLVQRALQRSGMDCVLERVETLEEFSARVRAQHFDAIVADYRLRGFTALEAWEALQGVAPQPPFILLSGAIGEAAAVSAIQRGMSDYLRKDDVAKLPHVVLRAIEVQQARLAKAQADADLALSERRLAEFAEHLQSTIEHERASIAREIHDDIGGSLAAVKLDLAWIQRHVQDPQVIGHLGAATEMLQHALGASQRIMMNLRPAILDQGLAAAVDWLADSFERRTGIRTSVHARSHDADMPKAVQLAAYRTAQEALTNISKHALCTQVSIDLADSKGMLTLEISDNGQGLARDAMAKPKAYGLKGLQERAKSVGGWVDVSSVEGRGTSIVLSVPLTDTAEDKPSTASKESAE